MRGARFRPESQSASVPARPADVSLTCSFKRAHPLLLGLYILNGYLTEWIVADIHAGTLNGQLCLCIPGGNWLSIW